MILWLSVFAAETTRDWNLYGVKLFANRETRAKRDRDGI